MIYKPIFDVIPSEEDKSPDQVYYDKIIVYDGGGVKDGNSNSN